MFVLLTALLLATRVVFAGPVWEPAPEPIAQRWEVAAPAGGWWTEDGTWARVHGAPEDRVTVRRLAGHAGVAVPRLAERLGVPVGVALDVFVAPSREAFDSMQPGRPPAWADGTAWPSLGLVFLHAPSARPGTAEPLEQVLDHEIVHVLLGRAFAPRVPPRWLQEGLAQYWTGEIGPQTTVGLTGPMSLGEVTSGFHGDPIRARLAYAASADLISFVAARWGEDAVRATIANMAAGDRFEDAVQRATGESAVAIESAWHARWSDPALWLNAVGTTDLLFGIGALAIVAGAWRVRRRNRRRLERWEAEDQWKQALEAREMVN